MLDYFTVIIKHVSALYISYCQVLNIKNNPIANKELINLRERCINVAKTNLVTYKIK